MLVGFGQLRLTRPGTVRHWLLVRLYACALSTAARCTLQRQGLMDIGWGGCEELLDYIIN